MATDRPYSGVLVSDFNIQNLAGYLNNGESRPSVHVTAAPFGQVTPTLLDEHAEAWQTQPDFAVVWTRPEGVIESFNRVLQHEPFSLEQLLAEVDEYASHLAEIGRRARFVLVPSWVLPPQRRDFGVFDLTSPDGASNVLMRMNLRLAEALASVPGVHMLNAQPWFDVAGKQGTSAELWYLAKIPFGHTVFREAAEDVKAALIGLTGQAKKLIVIDLDNTLWGGIVGELGPDHIRLGGHDVVGEAYVDFQRALKALSNRGILLAIASKNDEVVALDAIGNHPAMVLRPGDFAAWEINWGDKAQSLVNLVDRLKLGIDSVVFIDDEPAERARIREALPEVLVPEWPSEPAFFRNALLGLRCFYTASLNREDSRRAQMYEQEKKRQELKDRVGSIDQWLQSLQLRATVERLSEPNLARAGQLLNKTNQMNLATRRLGESELLEWATAPGHAVWTVAASDRFGDLGLVGLISLQVEGATGEIADFLLSCRAMGRRLEDVMLSIAVEHARAVGLSEIRARWIPTDRNGPCLAFFKQSRLRHDGDCFTWTVRDSYEPPAHVQLTGVQGTDLRSAIGA